jgi:hypothetical protein
MQESPSLPKARKPEPGLSVVGPVFVQPLNASAATFDGNHDPLLLARRMPWRRHVKAQAHDVGPGDNLVNKASAARG